MFIDSVDIILTAGAGGDGVITWRREKYLPKGGPTGGNGGDGGSITLKTDPEINSLQHFRNNSIIKAEKGLQGGSNCKQGRRGRPLTLKLPPGTLVIDRETGELLYDLSEKNESVLLCQGGKGGKGNHCFATPTHRTPYRCTLGKAGEMRKISLELKLIADVGLVGMPNAGKSTFLSNVAKINLKTAAYPFTTLTPNLSSIEFEDYSRILIADIPGIIENAHNNKGLGLNFLKHIERTELLVFVIDVSFQEGRDPFEEFLMLRNEIGEYKESVAKKPFLVLLNKMDQDGSEKQAELFKQKANLADEEIFCISALNEDNLPEALEAIRKKVQEKKKRFK